jgi:cytochrome oxidase Cu insertion factor (SCO1/SenC/PrrC family)
LAGTASNGIQLLSLSIDPLADTPEVLKAWLDGLGARAGWTAASPAKADLARARAFFDGVSGFGEDHSTAMSLVNRAGMLVWRTPELPAPDEVAQLLGHLQAERQDLAWTPAAATGG